MATCLKQKSPLFSYNIQASIGYRYKNWRFQSGIQYLKSGYEIKDLIFTQSPTPYTHAIVTSLGSYKVGFGQLGIPIQVGYAIPLNKKLSFIPYAGLFAAFTFSGSSRYEYKGEKSKNSLSGAALAGYGWFTGWGKFGLQLEYKVNNKVSIFGGPSVQYELVTTGESMENSFSNFHFNLGLSISL
ncbi:MAG: outer membrane beta-barrel protein [Taibaiella sp.]